MECSCWIASSVFVVILVVAVFHYHPVTFAETERATAHLSRLACLQGEDCEVGVQQTEKRVSKCSGPRHTGSRYRISRAQLFTPLRPSSSCFVYVSSCLPSFFGSPAILGGSKSTNNIGSNQFGKCIPPVFALGSNLERFLADHGKRILFPREGSTLFCRSKTYLLLFVRLDKTHINLVRIVCALFETCSVSFGSSRICTYVPHRRMR